MTTLSPARSQGEIVNQLLDRLTDIKPVGPDRWKALCPCHDDHNPSLEISFGDKGVIAYCFACRSSGDAIAKAVGLKDSDLFWDSPIGNNSKPSVKKNGRLYSSPDDAAAALAGPIGGPCTGTWIYNDASGRPIMAVLRFDLPDGKQYRPIHADGDGWRVGDPAGKLPLYHLDQLGSIETVYICEGEKAVDVARVIELPATTSAHGSKAADKTDWSPLAGREVVILPDNDEPGERYAADVALLLNGLQPPAKVRIVRLPDLPIKGDLVDYLGQDCFECKEPEDLAEHIEQLAEAAPYEEPAKKHELDISLVEEELQPSRPSDDTELFFAKRLVELHGDKLRFCKNFGWLSWTGSHWHRDELGTAQRLAKATIDRGWSELDKIPSGQRTDRVRILKKLSTARGIQGILELAESDPVFRVPIAQLNAEPMLLNLENGTLCLENMEFREHRHADLLTRYSPVRYNETAKAIRWNRFLDEIFQGDGDLIQFIQRAVGYSLTGQTTEQCFFFLHGCGANGKSVFLNVVQRLLGSYATTAASDTFMASDRSGARGDIARLAGARLVLSTEVQDGRRFDEGQLKLLTGGDVITARYLYRDEFEFMPRFKLWIAGNHKPQIRGNDYAIWRRVRLIPFNRTFTEAERDESLTETLYDELPGILNWSLGGLRSWRGGGLEAPAAVIAAVKEYRSSQDTIGQFLEESTTAGLNCVTPIGELYQAFSEWCNHSGERVSNKRAFSDEVANRGFQREKATGGVRAFRGIRLRTPVNDIKKRD